MRNIPFIVCFLLFCLLNSFAQDSTPTPAAETGARNENPAAASVLVPATSPTPSDPKPLPPKTNVETSSPIYVVKNAPARIPRFEAAPVIDGQLSDGIWQTAAVFGDFLQIQPGDNVAPSSPTEVLIGYDAKHLYIAFRVKQDRSKVRATVARRDNIFDDDYVGVYLDTFNDQRQAYAIFWNPLGVQADGTFTESNGEDYSVDLVMESKGVLTEDGFTIEAAIPFKSLRYEAGKDKQWGLHIFRRVKWNNNELNSWMRGDRSRSGSLNKAGRITGLEDIATTRQVEIIPSFTLSQSSRRSVYTFDGNPAGRFVNEGVRGDFGMTAKFSLTPTVTLDFAYNPDFAQVEADAPVTTANQRFPVFFAEKRPFFLERIDIFQTPMNVVHTRTIVDPDVAAKITGRRGKNTFGIMYASDNAPGNFEPDDREDLLECQKLRVIRKTNALCENERFVDKNADIGVVRFKRDIGKENNLGFFASTYNFVDQHNHAGGFDGRFRFDKKTVAEFQLVGTTTRDYFYDSNLDKTSYRTGNGIGYNVWLERADRNLYMNYLAVGRSRDYRADVGFRQRTDTNYLGSFIQYKTDPDNKKSIVFKRVQNATNISYDWRRRVQYWISNSQGMLALQRQTYIGAAFQLGGERVYEDEFGPVRKFGRPGKFTGDDPQRSTVFKAMQLFIETTPNKKLFAFVLVDHTWGQMDYDLGASGQMNPGSGDQLFIESSFRYQPTTAFQTQLNYNKVRLVRNDTGRVAFDDNIFSSRSTYQFSRDLFARLRLDYSTISERIRPQFVFGWTPSPGKTLYVGYSDNFNYYGRNPYTGDPERGLHSNGRTFFIKMSYLFRKSF
ncbi:MAG TPA: carbohydrate binding family 9 domain-containing protein [Pyrinomonadaceae bacterium]|jgi:hypothetical protein